MTPLASVAHPEGRDLGEARPRAQDRSPSGLMTENIRQASGNMSHAQGGWAHSASEGTCRGLPTGECPLGPGCLWADKPAAQTLRQGHSQRDKQEPSPGPRVQLTLKQGQWNPIQPLGGANPLHCKARWTRTSNPLLCDVLSPQTCLPERQPVEGTGLGVSSQPPKVPQTRGISDELQDWTLQQAWVQNTSAGPGARGSGHLRSHFFPETFPDREQGGNPLPGWNRTCPRHAGSAHADVTDPAQQSSPRRRQSSSCLQGPWPTGAR